MDDDRRGERGGVMSDLPERGTGDPYYARIKVLEAEVSRLREEKEASWNSAEHNARRAEAAEAEVARWKAEAMAAREMIGIALDVDGYPYPFKRSVSFDCGQKYLDIRAANEAREAAREGESDASSAE